MRARANNVMIGSLTLALIAGGFGAILGYQKFAASKQLVPLRVVFEGSAAGLKKGGSVNFGGVRVGEVVSLRLENPRRVVALAMIENSAPVRKDTLAGLEFQGLTGVAALALIGGSPDAPPAPLDADGIAVLVADPEATQDVPIKLKAALANVDRVIADSGPELKDALLGLETFTASLASSGERIDTVVGRAQTGVAAVDIGLAKTDNLFAMIEGVNFDELLKTMRSTRERVDSFNKKSGIWMVDARRMMGDVSAAVNKKFGPR